MGGCGEVNMSNINELARSRSFDGHLMADAASELSAIQRAWLGVDSSSMFIEAYGS
jgi:hypothetical protein